MMLRAAVLGLLAVVPAAHLVADPLYVNAGTPTRLFLSLDQDADGYLDTAELAAAPDWLRAAGHGDVNQDTRIDHIEFLSLLDRLVMRR